MKKEKKCLPYLDFSTNFKLIYEPHNIKPKNESKRIRIFRNQLAKQILNNTNLRNFTFSTFIYLKLAINLTKKYPHRRKEIKKSILKFWQSMQIRYKKLKNAKAVEKKKKCQ